MPAPVIRPALCYAALLLLGLHGPTYGVAPAIVLRDDELVFGGKALGIGQQFKDWERVLPANRRCEGAPIIRACVWDSIGLRVTMQVEAPTRVASARIYLVLPDPKDYTIILPAQAFTGRLELDGFAITSKTRFSDLRKSTRQDRNIRCGLRECVSPHGALEKSTSIYFGLSEHNENGAITAIELGGDAL